MASTTLTGDRRWASTRKSGMTVLGKVPKPINLPSQRLENHGLDPSVEIVPKGTLTWGSRPSTAVPNAWASSTLLSPNTDGSSGSPNHVNGRPSSGGGTRPSTSGSDRSHEPTSNAWGPNSRPSSASGVSVSNQTSIVANRPQSAETRPSSTQLSRFAEIPVESTGAWGPTRTAERSGPALSKTNDFSLISGDFPTLGSEKNSDSLMQRGHSSHGRPGSASGTAATQKEATRSLSAGEGNEEKQHDHGNVNIWKPDDYPYVGCAPNITWQRDPQQARVYPIGNIPPQPFGPWHNAPIHSSDGVWYRGGAVGGPYRPAGPSGSYPMEPYAYYPQFPARPLLSSESVPRPGAGQDGCHPKNGDLYHHHHQPDSYMVPSHPVRPGVYPGTPHEGYYGPPHASFCDSNEREVPISGMPDQSGACDQRPYQIANLDPGKFLAVPSGNASVMAKEQKDSNHAHETRPGQYRVLLKQHSGLEDKNDAQKKREQSVVANLPQIDRGILQGITTQEEDWRRNNKKDESMFVKSAPGQEALSQPTRDQKGHPTDPVITKSLVNASNEAGDSLLRRPENATFRVQDLPQNPVMKKNTSLIVKIEGLNNKVRSADGHSGGDEKMKHFKVANKAEHSTKAFSTKAASTEYGPTTGAVTFVSGELGSSTGNRNLISFSDETVSPRPSESLAFEVGKSDSSEVCEIAQPQVLKGAHIMQDRIDDHAKLRSSSQDDDELIKKSPGRDTSVLAALTNAGKDPGVRLLDCHASKDVAEESLHMANTSGVSYATSNMDSMDHKAQRAKLKEIAMRRAKELQEEEEERTREQKAKALAKLEELNRRTLAQSFNQKNYDVPPSNDVQHKKAEDEQTSEEKEKGLANHAALPSDSVHYSRAGTAGKIDAIITEAPGLTSTPNSDSMAQANVTGIKHLVGITDLSPGISSDVSVSATHDSAISNDSSLSLGREKITTEAATQLVTSFPQESNVSKQKQMGFRKRLNISEEENLSEKPTTAESTVSPKIPAEVAVPTLSSDSSSKEETPVHHRKRNNRHARNKNRLDEAITVSASPISAPTMGNLEKGLVGSGGSQPLKSAADANPDPAQSFSETIVNQGSISSSDQGLPQVTEKVHGRVGNQWKPQFTRKSRNQLAIRPLDRFHGSEAVIWAPVRPSNRNELSGEVNQKSTSETNNHASGKNGHDVQGGMKIKRAEMERYVPKPVAKELSQHENFQEPSLSLDQAVSCNMTRKPDSGPNSLECGKVDESAPRKPELSTDTKNREINKPNKRGKMHASWRQRSSVESSLQSSSLSRVSDPTKPMPESSDKNQPSDSTSIPERQFQHDDWGSSSGNLTPTEKIIVPAVIRDLGEPSRQKHLQFVVQTVEGSNCAPIDNKGMQSGRDDKIDSQSPVLDLNEAGRRSVPRTKNQNVVGEYMKSQWQPKSQAYSHNYHCETRGDGEQRIALQGVRLDKVSHSQSVENYPLQNEYNSSPAPRINDAERRNARHKETNRENTIVQQSKEKSCPTDKKLPTNSGMVSVDVSVRHEQPVSSAPRRQGHHNNCFGRGHEATYRDRNLGQDAGKQILHTNGDKRRSNSRFEYQRIGSYNKSGELFKQNPVIGEEAPEGPQAPGLRYRERGQHRSRRGGHSYSQRSGVPGQVADSCNSGE